MGSEVARYRFAASASRRIAHAQEGATMKRKSKHRRKRLPLPSPWADRIWLRHNSADPNWLWYHVFDAVDRQGNKKPLIKMLRDPKCEVTPTVRECLADLLERYKLVRLPGEQRIPVYAVSQAEAVFCLMRDQVLELTANGTSQDKAIERVARSWYADADENTRHDAENKLDSAVKGKRTSLSRTRDRLARLR
jgi:hypothetical protein